MPVTLISVQVGLPKRCGPLDSVDPHDRPWLSGFYKEPISGPIALDSLNLAGDGQADLENHGGVDKAICAYAAEHYPIWEYELERPGVSYGAFGENFTIDGINEDGICIGDIWQVGDAQVQVSQPRQPCWKLGRRWELKEMPGYVIKTGRTGWYFRVIQPGTIAAGMPMTRIERPEPTWTITRANRVMYVLKKDRDLTRELANIPELSESWREPLRFRADQM